MAEQKRVMVHSLVEGAVIVAGLPMATSSSTSSSSSSESPRASSEGFALLDQATIEVLRSETLSSVVVGETGGADADAGEGSGL